MDVYYLRCLSVHKSESYIFFYTAMNYEQNQIKHTQLSPLHTKLQNWILPFQKTRCDVLLITNILFHKMKCQQDC